MNERSDADKDERTDRNETEARPETPRRVETKERSVRGEVTDGDSPADTFLPQDRMEELRARWNDIQAEFVDDPRTAVQQAHGLVTKLVTELTETFSRERSGLESEWNRGEEADTENLRIALKRYRLFFNRLLR